MRRLMERCNRLHDSMGIRKQHGNKSCWRTIVVPLIQLQWFVINRIGLLRARCHILISRYLILAVTATAVSFLSSQKRNRGPKIDIKENGFKSKHLVINQNRIVPCRNGRQRHFQLSRSVLIIVSFSLTFPSPSLRKEFERRRRKNGQKEEMGSK